MAKIRWKFEWISPTFLGMGLMMGLVSTLATSLANAAEAELPQNRAIAPPAPPETASTTPSPAPDGLSETATVSMQQLTSTSQPSKDQFSEKVTPSRQQLAPTYQLSNNKVNSAIASTSQSLKDRMSRQVTPGIQPLTPTFQLSNDKVNSAANHVTSTVQIPKDRSSGEAIADMQQLTPVSGLSDTKINPAANQVIPDSEPAADESSEEATAEMDVVTSVSQLSDVKPSDWAFDALRTIVERYGVIAGYPDGSFRGNRAMTRYEFAAGLNAALNRVSELLTAGTSNLVRKEDLENLQKLQNQFAAELVALRGRVDGVDTRVAFLKGHQFSTTTILVGEVETVIGSVWRGNNVVTRQPAPRNTTFQDRLRMEFNTSFTGKDQLRLQISAGNIIPIGGVGAFNTTTKKLATTGIFGTNDGKTSDNYSPGVGVNIPNLGGARYRFPLGPNTTANFFVQSDGAYALGLTVPINPYFEGSASNGISRYSRRNMVYDYGDTGAGVAVLHKFGKQFELGLEYTAVNPNIPTPGNGEFDGRYVALGQVIYYGPGSNFRLGLTYANTYSPRGGSLGLTGGQTFGPVIGSNLANSTGGRAVIANLYGIEPFWRITPKFAINGWLGYTAERFLKFARLSGGNGKVWDWGIGLAFPDLLKKANLGGIFVGMEPRLTSLSKNIDLGAGAGKVDRNNSLHIEAFYQYQVNDNIAITPGVIWITAPDFNARNPNSIVTWFRTTFKF